jgi:hypothetical protein
MKVNFLLSFKDNDNLKYLDNNILSKILSTFSTSTLKYRQRKKRVFNNILKNKNIQDKKEKIINKTNLFLNKLSEDNIEIILENFLKTIGEVSIEDYEKIQLAIYIKILNEINFVTIYLKFIKLLFALYYKKCNLIPSYFFNLIQSKVEFDYLNKKDIDYLLKKYNNENYRKANLILIKNLIDENFLDRKLIKFVNSILINQNNIYDIYEWFKEKDLTSSEKNKLELKSNDDINYRSRVLLNNLLHIDKDINIKIKKNNFTDINIDINEEINLNNNNNNKFNNIESIKINNGIKKYNKIESQNIEFKNIYEEYFLLLDEKEVIEYILNECQNAIQKNNFSYIGIIIFFDSNNDIKNKLLNLYSILIKKKKLYKSNLSRGLMIFIKNNKDYEKYKTDIRYFLKFLLKKGITNGIEFLYKKFDV